MVDEAIVKFIRDNLNRGYNISAVKNHLLKSGYNAKVVDNAINSIYGKKPSFVISSKMLMIGGGIVFIVVIVLLFLFLFPKEAKEGFSVSVEGVSSAKAGESLGFNINIRGYDEGVVDVEVFLSKDDKVEVYKEDKMAGGGRISIDIPDDAEGDYTLKIKARYGSELDEAVKTINIEKEEIIVDDDEPAVDDEVPSLDGGCGDCDDDNQCTADECKDSVCVNEQIVPCCGNKICESSESIAVCPTDCKEAPTADKRTENLPEFSGMTIFEIMDKIGEDSKSDLKKAEKLCAGIRHDAYKDRCFSKVAEDNGKYELCGNIADDGLRDFCYKKVAISVKDSSICEFVSIERKKNSCYMDFVIKKDYSVCNKITDEYLQRSCESLKNLEETS